MECNSTSIDTIPRRPPFAPSGAEWMYVDRMGRPAGARYNCELPDICWIAVLTSPHLRCLLVALSCVAAASRAGAQVLPENPLRTADGRLVVSAEVTGTFGSQDNIAFFNYTDYENNALRMLRFATSGVWKPTSWLALTGEVRSEDLEHPSVYAAYARIK